MKPRLLDLFCGAGGAAKGYQEAGFYVVGVDNKPQPRYCGDEFYQADAMTYPLEGYDAIHASPPCQRYSRITLDNGAHPDLYAAVRGRLIESGLPWVIENVIGAPYQHGVVLCGSSFGLQVRRHRNFETSWLLLNGHPCDHAAQPEPILVSGESGGNGLHHRKGVREEWPAIMEMPWATPHEATQAVPPAFTRYIGEQLMRYLEAAT